ncbi:MAG: hypothetical protein ACK4YP_00625, partial [Myxococcota bacterium]
MTSSPDPSLRMRPKATLALMAAVISVVGGIVVATVGWYVRVQTTEGVATGERVRITFRSTCDAEARPVLAARLADYGMPAAPSADVLAFDVTLPGALPDERAHVPTALAASGVLEVSVDGARRDLTVQNVGMQLAFSGAPVTLLMVSESLPDRGVTATLDGVAMDVEEVTGAELQLAARAGQSTDAIRLASDRAVQIRHPLPCPVTVVGVDVLGAGG